MTDLELLELAAKSAGLRTRSDRDHVWIVEDDGSPVIRWRPLTDDGDALRLAAKLRITVAYPDASYIGDGYVTASFQEFRYRYLFPKQTSFSEEFGDDPLPAIRRAIVRAAAQIQITKEIK